MKYVALDIGNVLCRVGAKPFLEILSRNLNITVAEGARFLKRFQQIHDLGFTTMEDELKDKYNIKSPFLIEDLVQAWNDSITPDYDILDKLNSLRDSSELKVALLSNIGVEHAVAMQKKLDHNNFFPGAIKHFSCYVGARKPSTIFYQSFLLQYPEFKGCLYVDDLVENLEASKPFGFKTYHFTLENPDYKLHIEELESLILKA